MKLLFEIIFYIFKFGLFQYYSCDYDYLIKTERKFHFRENWVIFD